MIFLGFFREANVYDDRGDSNIQKHQHLVFYFFKYPLIEKHA